MDIQPQMTDAPDAIELDEVKGDIEFRDVWFSYVPGEWVLQGVSFHVEPRQTVAFVGSTGSGKSTILSLICRNYEFQKGEILIDGIDYLEDQDLLPPPPLRPDAAGCVPLLGHHPQQHRPAGREYLRRTR